MRDLTVSIIQDELDWQDSAANRQRFSRHIRSLSAANPDLIVLPEMFNTGFCMQPIGIDETMEGPTVTWMREQAQSVGVVLTGSLIIADAGGYKNRMIWAPPDGSISFYDKRHLFRFGDEHINYTAGGDRVVVELHGWRLALFVCYDLRFPVWSRNRGDYDVAVYVANWPNARQHAWDTLLKARAIENQAYVVGVNRVGADGIGNEFSGGSVVHDFLGQAVVDCSRKIMNVTAKLSRQALDQARDKFPAGMDADGFSIVN